MTAQRFGLGFLHGQRLDHQNAAVLGFGGQRVLERQRTHFLRQADGVTARVRAKRSTAAAEQIDARGAVARRTGALLPIHLLAGARDLRPVLDLVGAALAFCQLPDDAAMNDVGARLEPENSVGQRDRAGLLAVERGDLNFHITRPSSASWRACFRPWQGPVSLDLWPLPAWLRPLLQRALLQFWPQRAWPRAWPRAWRRAWRRALLQSLA